MCLDNNQVNLDGDESSRSGAKPDGLFRQCGRSWSTVPLSELAFEEKWFPF